MQEQNSVIKVLRLLFFTLIFSFPYSGINQSILAQDMNRSSKQKGDFVTQDSKELEKIKKLKVKTRTKTVFGYDLAGNGPLNGRLASKEFFNNKGFITQMNEYDVYGQVETAYKFYYDTKGNPTKAEMKQKNGVTRLQLSKYDPRGNEIERQSSQSGRHEYDIKTMMKYDKQNNQIEIDNYSLGKLTDQKFNNFKDGKRVSSIVKDEKGNTILNMTPDYDSTGKMIKETNSNDNMNLVYQYKYDAVGNLIEVIDNETKGQYSYDDKKNVIEQKVFLLDGRRQLRLVFNYGAKGLQTEMIRYDNSEKPVVYTKFEYEYYK
jgi:YD repeat-containing protein